jgi:Gas vesicle protein K/Gas vesicle protein
MPPIKPVAAGNVSLVDTLDHLLDRGAVLLGDATLSVADVDLIYVGVNLLISSVETMRRRGDWPGDGRPVREPPPDGPSVPSASSSALPNEPTVGATPVTIPVNQLLVQDAPEALEEPITSEADAEPAPERSLVRLVLALVELLRQLVERQAIRRLEGGGLSEQQVERMGGALQELAEKMEEIRVLFGLREQDLALDLGPLGRLV